jgi:serine-type D-Ala-D-Ala carboxypeptidase/endopeptidase (penicillin-binding protein 4)
LRLLRLSWFYHFIVSIAIVMLPVLRSVLRPVLFSRFALPLAVALLSTLSSSTYTIAHAQTGSVNSSVSSSVSSSANSTSATRTTSAASAGYGADFQTSDTTLPATVRELRRDLNQILADSAGTSRSVGVYVWSVKNKDLLYARNENKALLPASNMKIFTTAAALDYLGEDFRYTTTIFLDGIVRSSGEYIGNVIIRGAGDPSLSSFFTPDPMTLLAQWRQKFDSLGIKSVVGNIIGDDTYFNDTPLGYGWQWDDAPYAYSSEISALSFNDNLIAVTVESADAVGKPALTTLTPSTDYVSLANTLTTVRADSTRSIDYSRALNSNTLELSGALPLDTSATRSKRTLTLSVSNPTLYTLTLFKQALQAGGIEVRGGVQGVQQNGFVGSLGAVRAVNIRYPELRPIHHHVSPPLKDIVKVINTHSHNLCAEMLLRTLGKEVYGTGSAEKGVDAVREFCKQHSIALDGSLFFDGSGLSRMNLVTAKQVATTLAAIQNTKFHSAFVRSLASPTEKSTLFGRMKGSLAERSLRAKTGTLGAVSALSGYVLSRDQEQLVFSLIFNNFASPPSEIRSIQDAICMRLASFAR